MKQQKTNALYPCCAQPFGQGQQTDAVEQIMGNYPGLEQCTIYRKLGKSN